MAQKDLGMVTSYAYALSQGYTGTEEEFAEGVLASAEYADNAQASASAAAQSKIDAEAAASSVQASAQQIATNTADIADIKSDLSDVNDELQLDVTENLSTQHLATLTGHNYQYISTNKNVGVVIDYTPVTAANATGWAVYECEEGDQFSLTGKGGNNSRLWCFVDSEDKVLQKSLMNVDTGNTPITITAPADGKLICNVVSFTSPVPTLTKTYKISAIEDYGERIDSIEEKSIYYDDIVTNEGIRSPYYRGTLNAYQSDITNNWYKGQNESYTGDGLGEHTTYATVISLFDALMAMDTEYITKNTLGVASDTSYTLYEYVFTPKTYAQNKTSRIVPKLMLQCCQHGFEKCAVYGMYYWLYDVVNNWDKNERLDFIRHHVEIHLIPVVNPWGFDNESYLNANGVNLNRNYDNANWTYYPPTDTTNSSGEAPFDQPETAIVKSWVESNPNAFLFVDCHTNGHYNSNGYNEMNPLMPVTGLTDAYYNKIFGAFARQIEDQTEHLPVDYQSIQPPSSDPFCGKIQTDEPTGRGTANKWATTMENIIGFTFEGFNGLVYGQTQIIGYMSGDAKKIYSEMLGNNISALLRAYAD